jgi:hypothetical protein
VNSLWDAVWGKVLFQKYMTLLEYCSSANYDFDHFSELMNEFENLYGIADIAIQGAYHEMVVYEMNT